MALDVIWIMLCWMQYGLEFFILEAAACYKLQRLKKSLQTVFG